jgi:environmental stress-induced protein Ves
LRRLSTAIVYNRRARPQSAMHRVLTPADYRRTAWKNGGGRTTEIVVHPPKADLDAFVWRASVADVERDGPFSTFPGVDRTLVLLAGAGFSLTGGDMPVEMRAHYEPVTFSGDVALECRLHDGAVRDFNLMVRRAAARGELAVVREEAGTIKPARFRLCYVAAGACECLVAGNVPLVLHEGDALFVDAENAPPSALHVNPLTPDAIALAASIDLVSIAA